MKSILDPAFRYVPSHATDIRKTFERIRREQEAANQAIASVTNVTDADIVASRRAVKLSTSWMSR